MICQIRKVAVAPTPEEEVRQALLSHMIFQGGYPPELISVEVNLSSLPNRNLNAPDRRIDILVFTPSSLEPLMLIECKAIPLDASALRQALGYNHFVGAPWLVLSNGKETKTGSFYEKEGWVFNEGMPNFEQALTLSQELCKPKENLVEFFENSPFYGMDLDLERSKSF